MLPAEVTVSYGDLRENGWICISVYVTQHHNKQNIYILLIALILFLEAYMPFLKHADKNTLKVLYSLTQAPGKLLCLGALKLFNLINRQHTINSAFKSCVDSKTANLNVASDFLCILEIFGI